MWNFNYESLKKFHISLGLALIFIGFLIIMTQYWWSYEQLSDIVINLNSNNISYNEDYFNMTTNQLSIINAGLINFKNMGSIIIITGTIFFLIGYLSWIYNSLTKLFKRRRTESDGVEREYYNSLFTDLQKIKERLTHWEFKDRNNKNQKADDITKLNLLMVFHQAEQQKKYTIMFVILTIFMILTTLMNCFVI